MSARDELDPQLVLNVAKIVIYAAFLIGLAFLL